MKATAVLITTKADYPPEVLESLLGKFDEILIETECPSIHRRYQLATKAKNDLIYVQDDDCITNVEALFKAYNGQITNAITQHHLDWYKDKGVTLVGFGAFFPKNMIDFSEYLDKYPVDSLFLSQTDRVFTYLNRPFNQQLVTIKNLPSATESGRMSTKPDHWSNLERILARCHTLEL